MTSNFAYSLLGSADPEPLIVVADASDGAWVAELAPSEMPALPIRFFCVRDGVFGPVLHPAGLVLVRDDLLHALRDLTAEPFADYAATIQPPQSEEINGHYSVVKVSRTTPLASVTARAGRPVVSVVSEAPDALLASHELRGLLEQREVPGLEFSEPLFFGTASAVS